MTLMFETLAVFTILYGLEYEFNLQWDKYALLDFCPD
jgi:hypothetical protein